MNHLILNRGLTLLTPFLSLDFLKKWTGRSFIAPFYHTVSDDDLRHLKHLYPIKKVDAFKKELDFFQKHFEPIGLFDLLKYIEQHNALPENKFFLSFDDGFRECEEIVMPILLKRGIPACFFINPPFIDNKDLMYRCKQSLVFDKILESDEKARFKNHFSYLDSDETVLDRFGISFEAYLKKQKPYMSSVQLQNLVENGFDLGAHSQQHLPYYALSLKEQIAETLESLKAVQQFQPKAYTFSFPFTDDKVDNSFFEAIKKSDLKITFACAGLKDDSIVNHIQRYAMEFDKGKYLSTYDEMKAVWLAYKMKKLLNKSKVYH